MSLDRSPVNPLRRTTKTNVELRKDAHHAPTGRQKSNDLTRKKTRERATRRCQNVLCGLHESAVSNEFSRDPFVLEAGLARANHSVGQAVAHFRTRERLDFAGLPGGSLAFLLTGAARASAPPMLVVTADQDGAFATAQDLRFFGVAGKGGEDALPVLRFPRMDTSPFLQVGTDRKSAMERVAAL